MKNLIKNKVRHWYIPLILGILFIGLGVLVLFTPISTFLTIAVFLSLTFLISGVVEVVYSITSRKTLGNWGWSLAGGIMTLLLGVLLTARPDLSALFLSFLVGFWLLFRSVMYAVIAIELKDSGMKNWGWIMVFGILGALISFILLWNPLLAGMTFVIWLGFGLISLGIINIITSFSIRKFKKVVDGLNE